MAQPERQGVLGWALAQCGHLAYGLVLALGGGIGVSLWRRTFSGRAWAAACALYAAMFYAAAQAAHYVPPAPAAAWPLGVVFVLTLLAGVGVGAVAARLSRRMALWELYAATAAAALGAHLLLGRPKLSLHRVSHRIPESWGEALLGPLWDHLLLLWAPMMLAAAAVGASLTLLFFGMGQGGAKKRRDWGAGIEWRLAVRHIVGNHGTGLTTTAWVTVAGVALGVASLIIVTAVMSGYQHDIQAKILSTNAHLVVQKYGIDFAEHPHVCRAAAQTPGVVAAAPFAFSEAMLSAGGRGMGVLLKGIDPARAVAVTKSAERFCLNDDTDEHGVLRACHHAGEQGAALMAQMLAPADGLPPLIVGYAIYQKLGLPLGSPLSLMTPVGMAQGRGGAPKRKTFRLAGTFASGMHEFDAHLVYVALPDAQALLGLGDRVTGVEIRVQDAQAVSTVSQALLERLGQYPYRTLDWRQLNASIFMALGLQKVVMFLVLTFIVVVAAFNIASTLFMAVVDKGPQIAVLQSMGASQATVMKIFVIEGLIAGTLGTVLGAGFGLWVTQMISRLQFGIAADVYMVDTLTVRLDPEEVLITVVAALVICHLATLYPALRATRSRPIDLLRQG